jgi:hypothetical protein
MKWGTRRVTWRTGYLFEGVFAVVFEAEAHLVDSLFARGQGAEDLPGVHLEVDADGVAS